MMMKEDAIMRRLKEQDRLLYAILGANLALLAFLLGLLVRQLI